MQIIDFFWNHFCADKCAISHLRRGDFWARVGILPLSAMLFLGLVVVDTAGAQTPQEIIAASSPGPVGVTQGRLKTQVVEVEVEEVNGRVIASVDSRFHIENADALNGRPVTVTFPIALPNGLVFDPRALEDVVVEVDGEARELPRVQEVIPITELMGTRFFTLTLDLEPGGVSVVKLGYRQDLGSAEMATFHFATSVASRWPGPVTSARVSIKFPWPTSREQILTAVPAGAEFDGLELTWYWTNYEPQEDVRVTFVRPSLWEQITEARSAALESPRSAEVHQRLASLYQRLAPTVGFTTTLGAPFSAMAVAEWEAAKESATMSADGDLLCRVHGELAAFYRERAYRPDGTVDVLHLHQLVEELSGAYPDCRASGLEAGVWNEILGGYFILADDARRKGRYETAVEYIEKASALSARHPDLDPVGLNQERRLLMLQWIHDLLEKGRTDLAIKLAREELSLAELGPVVELSPRFGAIQLAVHTSPERRRFAMSLRPPPFPLSLDQTHEAVNILQKRLQDALGKEVEMRVTENVHLLEWTVPLDSAAVLVQRQARLAYALPEWPEVAFVVQALLPESFELENAGTWLKHVVRYKEVVDTTVAKIALLEHEQLCERERLKMQTGLELSGDLDDRSQLMGKVQLQLVNLACEDWARLVEDSGAVYEIDWLPETEVRGPIHRAWSLKIGQAQEMKLQREGYRLPALVRAAVLGLLAVAFVVIVLFLVAWSAGQ